ncbi:L,D-transpeptidase family protein [Pseudahrensia aquimaris]|uniref:L,D-transpeptidase family protein n=1 Tax=Pseudahrensia aquimaris TaxID=744461 RepID=A0ABW3FIN3_9HYPH
MFSGFSKVFTPLVLVLALFAAGCSSSSRSVSGYTGPSISSVSAKRSAARADVRSARSEVRQAKREVAKLERDIARNERRLKRNISTKRKDTAKKAVRADKRALRSAKRSLRRAERSLRRAERRQERAERAVTKARNDKREAERRFAQAERDRKAAERASQRADARRALERKDADKPDNSRRLFALSDPALANISDYKARVDGGFPVAAIPVSKMNKRNFRQVVNYRTSHKPGTLVVDPHGKFLYLVQPGGKAMRYGIGVGKAGFEWSGEAHIGWKQEWPKWTPPAEMIERRPDLAKWGVDNGGMPGGPTNPLGARALYLMQGNVDTLYRLHGTPEWSSIGTAASSGCIRLMNQDVIDLYKRVPNGTKVVVL